MQWRIVGTGSCVPEKVLTNADLEKMVDTSDEWIVTHSGVRERRIAVTETVASMGSQAARQALQEAGIETSALAAVVCSTCTGDMICPSTACQIAAALGASCPAFDVNAACSGFLYALQVGSSFCESGPVLVVAAEKLSRVVDWTDRSSCILFGDGAAAVVLQRGETWSQICLHAQEDARDVLTIPGLYHGGVGEGLSPSYLFMKGPEVFRYATTILPEMVSRAMEGAPVSLEEVRWIVPHQANYRIISSAAKRLGIPVERFALNLERYGNTSSSSIGIMLDELNKKGCLKKGDWVVLVAFGGGLTAASALFQWT